jgi:peptidyl-prolyl cis-trans isomerase SurA
LKPGSLSAEERYFKKGDNEYLDAVQWAVGQNNYEIKGKAVWVDVKKVENARSKTFKEANGEVIRDLQKVLEKDWVNQLKVKYPVIVNEEEIKRILN